MPRSHDRNGASGGCAIVQRGAAGRAALAAAVLAGLSPVLPATAQEAARPSVIVPSPFDVLPPGTLDVPAVPRLGRAMRPQTVPVEPNTGAPPAATVSRQDGSSTATPVVGAISATGDATGASPSASAQAPATASPVAGTPRPAAGPAPGDIVDALVLPRVVAFAKASLELQNAVVSRCSVPGATREGRLDTAFLDAVRSAGAIVGVDFGTDVNLAAADMLLTSLGETVNSRERVAVLVSDPARVPTTLPALRSLEPVLRGLPALEHATLTRAPTEAGCILATTIAANVRDIAGRMKSAWERGRVDRHWAERGDDLAGRRRLFDILSAMIHASQRFERAVTPPRGSRRLDPPFAETERNREYFASIVATMQLESAILDSFAEGQPAVEDAVTVLAARVDEVAKAFDAWSTIPESASRAESLRDRLADVRRYLRTELTDAFGFDPGAFDPPLVKREVPTPSSLDLGRR